MAAKFLNLTTVKAKTTLSRSSIYLRMKEGTFPASIKLGARRIGWLESDIDQWIEQKLGNKQEG